MDEEHEHKLTLLCSECGDLIEVADPARVILSWHLLNACPAMTSVVGVEK